MSKKWIDISVPNYQGMVHWPGDPAFETRLVKSIERGDVCNLTHIALSAHTGTHMDSPRHFIRDGRAMEAFPPDATIGRARVIEIKDKVCIHDQELKAHKLKRGERILFKTRNSKRSWKTAAFDEDFIYISKEGAQHIVDCGVMTVGVDYLSVGGFKKDGVETHQILLGKEVWIIEGLNLAKIKPGTYDLVCLPIHLLGSDGAPARAVLR